MTAVDAVAAFTSTLLPGSCPRGISKKIPNLPKIQKSSDYIDVIKKGENKQGVW